MRPIASASFPIQSASLICSPEHDPSETNASFFFERDFELNRDPCSDVRLAITAETRYRVWINDEWVADGPARGYPHSRYYDDLEVSSFLKPGTNRIRVSVTHFGVDTFQSQRAQPFLLAALYGSSEEIALPVATDGHWRTRRASEWGQFVPRISCQLGFEEHVDATVTVPDWSPAQVLESLAASSRFSLARRATGMLNRIPRKFERVVSTQRVKNITGGWVLAIRELLSPSPKGINLLGMAGVFASVIRASAQTALRIFILGPVESIFCGGRSLPLFHDQDLTWCEACLSAGDNWLTVAVCTHCDHATGLSIGYESDDEVEWRSPHPNAETPWLSSGPLWTTSVHTNCFINKFGDATPPIEPFVPSFGGQFSARREEVRQNVRRIAQTDSPASFDRENLHSSVPLAGTHVSRRDAYLYLRTDRALAEIPSPNLRSLPAVLRDSHTRLLLDLGDMTVGYFDISFEVPAETIVDAFFFEHLDTSGTEAGPTIQYLHQDGFSYRNSFRYVAHAGKNRFTSRLRRGFRYAQITFRNAPVRLSDIGVFESTYQPTQRAEFTCSDPLLNRIYEISQRTLLLCMEDTFTDCPSYEQTFWVGDARNQALFACFSFGAYDLAQHSALLAARSLDDLPLIASQCPSGWDALIPSFSFLWGLSVWDIYLQSGDLNWLREIYPAAKANLETALLFCRDQGLFSAPTWNFFDWTAIDQNQETVLHNSLLLGGALTAGHQCALALGNEADAIFFQEARFKLLGSINRLWDESAAAYRDAILPGGSLSQQTCQHTSFLALLFDAIPANRKQAAIANCLTPPPTMTRVGSPNALFFLLSAIVKNGFPGEALKLIRSSWGAMIDAGALTCWETINQSNSRFPTRSHCHGWSSSPVYLLPQILFGLEIIEPGWRKISIKPNPLGLDYAKTRVCTPFGPLDMEWQTQPDGSISTKVHGPKEITVAVIES